MKYCRIISYYLSHLELHVTTGSSHTIVMKNFAVIPDVGKEG